MPSDLPGRAGPRGSHAGAAPGAALAGAESPGRVLPFGAFYGRPDVRRAAPGLEVAVLDADPHRVVERHAHAEAHFVFVLAGLYVSTAAGAPAVSAGPLLVYNPAGTTHRDRFEALRGASRRGGPQFEGRFLTLSVGADLVDAAATDGRAPEAATVLRDPDALALARRLARAVTGDESGREALLGESLALTLLAAAAPGRRSERTDVAAAPPRWLAVARELLDDRCGEAVRVADLARAAGVHPVHLARVFRRHLGCTPGEYLRHRRFERAAVLLRETARPLSDVALSCGFADQSHLAHAFRRHAGITPRAYRRAEDRSP
ncbi:AraC family transcriptional regulator [Gemmatimonadetes bacterium T265]|nr:AraC family transcriptional regulator [Gemmatimonadetes bacterium T265]